MQPDRRSGVERRELSLAAYWHGSLNPRRRTGRRRSDFVYPVIDWHSSRVFALVLTILALSILDGVLTVMLMSHGASEVNPVMALFLPHKLVWFVTVKMLLTGFGAFVLVACSRMQLFRRIPGEVLLYAVLAGYVTLIAYELQLLQLVPLHPLLSG